MLESWMMLHTRRRLLHHLVLIRCPSRLVSLLSTFVILIVVSATLIRKVCWTLVFMRAAIVLEPPDRLVDIP